MAIIRKQEKLWKFELSIYNKTSEFCHKRDCPLVVFTSALHCPLPRGIVLRENVLLVGVLMMLCEQGPPAHMVSMY